MKKPNPQEHLFTALTEAEVLSAVTLFREPLYRYAGGTVPELHVLLCGTGAYADAMLQTILVVGQMLERPLHVHVLAPDATEYRERLVARAPMLEKFSDISGKQPAEQTLVRFEFVKMTRFDLKASREILSRMLGVCRYIVVDMPRKTTLMKTIVAQCQASEQTRLVCHTGETEIKPAGKLRFRRIDRWDAAACESSLRLSWRAFRLSYFYDRYYGSQSTQMAESLASFRDPGNRYVQRANLLAVLHTGYKIASVGVNPAGRRASIMAGCAGMLYGADRTRYDALTALEHRRWMMEKILEGYHSPTMNELLAYCFNGERLADRWWNNDRQFHNCLCISQPRSQSSLLALKPAEWNQYAGQELSQAEAICRIEGSGFDPLDQMSLLVHYLAGQKLKEMDQDVERGLARLKENMDRFCSPVAAEDKKKAPPRQDEVLSVWFAQLQRGGELHREAEMYRLLNGVVQAYGLPAEPAEALRTTLARYVRLAREFYSLKDYKSMDESVVELPLLMYTMPAPITLVKVGKAGLLENVASALLIEPQKLILTDLSGAEVGHVAAFFAGRGGFLEVSEAHIGAEDDSQRFNRLKRLVRNSCKDGFCVVDVTGADGVEILELTTFVREEKLDAAVITCDSAAQRIRNLHNFPEADCIRGQIKLRVGEVFQLMGTTQKMDRNDEYDAMEVLSRWKELWGFYNRNKEAMSGVRSLISIMVNAHVTQKRDLAFSRESREEWFRKFEYFSMSRARFDALRIGELLEDLQRHRFVRNLNITSTVRNTVDYTGEMNQILLQAPCMSSLLRMDAKAVALKVVSKTGGGVGLEFFDEKERQLYVNVEFAPGCFKHVTLWQHVQAADDASLVNPSILSMLESRRVSGSITEYKESKGEASSEFVNEKVCTFVERDANMVYITCRDKSGKKRVYSHPRMDVIKRLNEMRQARLIHDLHTSEYVKKSTGETMLSCTFRFTSAADRNHLLSTGSFLESRVFAEAMELGCFDDVRTNYKFAWSQDGETENEFDVLLTRGLQVFIVSCKATDSMKEHLYEVSALAKRFAKTAQPIIVYADKERVKPKDCQRAKTMGVRIAYAEGGKEDETIQAVLKEAAGVIGQ